MSNTPKSAIRNPQSATRKWWIFGGAAAITFLLYVPTLWYGFVWDDGHLIVSNRFLSRTNPVEIFARGFWYNPDKGESEGDMSYYRPLPVLTYFFERREFELNPTGYHLTNVILHTGIVLLLCFVLLELLGSVWLAGLGGLLFGIHPAHNCIVAFVSGRPYLLALLMLLFSFYALLKGRRSPQKSNQPVSLLWPALCGLSFLLAMTAVEATVFFGLLAGLWLLLNRRQYPRLYQWFGAGFAAVAVYLALRLGVAKISMMPESIGNRILSQPLRVLNTFGQQLALFFVPFNQKVIYTVGPEFTDFGLNTVLGVLFLLLPVALILWNRSEKSSGVERQLPTREILGYAWMVLFMLPFSNLLFLGPSGRMLYLSGIGVLILLLVPALRFARLSRSARIGVWIVAGIYVAALAGQLIRRNAVWQSELSLSRQMTLEAPDSPGGHLNYGAALATAGRTDEAIEQYLLAVDCDSNYAPPHNRLAFALVERDEVEAAVEHFRAVVRIDPSSADAQNNLALTLKRVGQIDSAIAHYQIAVRLSPNPDTTLNNLGRAYLARGDLRPAIEAFKQVLAREPYFTAARENLIQAYLAAGFKDSAAMVEK